MRIGIVGAGRIGGSAARLWANAGHDVKLSFSRDLTKLELFFDLVFVTAVTQLGLSLAHDVSLRGYLHFGLLFVPVWWAWVGYTNYADRFDSDDLPVRALMLGGSPVGGGGQVARAPVRSALEDPAGRARLHDKPHSRHGISLLHYQPKGSAMCEMHSSLEFTKWL